MFWRPGTSKPGADLQSERTVEGDGAGSFVQYNSNISLSMQQQRQRLPVFKYRNQILHLLEKYQTLVLSGSTGSGKSTQVPQYLHESGWTNEDYSIAVTQPRRVAATSVANRVAEEMGTFMGREVGFAIRFENCCDEKLTKIKYMTDGYLIREMMSDPLLTKYSVILLDEVHETTLCTDLVVGLMKKILRQRPDLRLIISSATLDAEKFVKFFNFKKILNKKEDTAFALNIEGRSYPVDMHYLQSPTPNYVKTSIETVLDIHKHEGNGDVLVFLTGEQEVQEAMKLLQTYLADEKKSKETLLVLPLYAGLPISEQLKVFQRTPPNMRKVVFSTNVAEASVTINGIVYVVDCGFVKLKVFNVDSTLDSLLVVPVSKASADQRAGRAGRVRSGKAYRLFTEDQFEKLQQFSVPEMQRTNLASAVLQLKSLGINNILRFSFVHPPPAQLLVHGVELLHALGAIDEECSLTQPLGVRMAEFPLDPMLSKMLLTSGKYECSEEAVTLAAMIQIENIFVSIPNKKNKIARARLRFAAREGDHLTLVNVYRAFVKSNRNPQWCHANFLNYQSLRRVEKIRSQLVNMLKRYDIPMVSCETDDEKLRKCIISGFFANVAKYHPSGEYRTVRTDHPLHLHPTSVLATEEKPAKLLIFHQVLCTSRDYMRDATVIQLDWLLEIAHKYYNYGTDTLTY